MKVTSLLTVFVLAPFGAVEGSVAASAAKALKSMDYRYFVAGGTCASFSHSITVPIDVIKTKKQSLPEKYDKGLAAATALIIKEEGPQALLGGLGPTAVGYGVEGAMKFGFYEICKPVFSELFQVPSGTTSPIVFLLASIVAGAIASVLLCPMESTRIRIVTDPLYADAGLLNGLPRLIREEGLSSTFSGIWAMLAKQVPYTFGKQVSFDVFAGMLYAFFRSAEYKWLGETEMKWAVSLSAAFLASLVACILSQPGDMILTETYRPQKQKGNGGDSPSFGAIVQRIYDQGGLPRFFTGTGARILHVGLIITSQLVVYDLVKQMLGLPATGSH